MSKACNTRLSCRYSLSCLCTPRRLVSSNIRIVVVPNQRVRSRLIWPQYPPDMPPTAPRCEPTPTLVDSSWLAYVTKRQPLSNNRRLHTPVSHNIVPTPCYLPTFSETDTVRLFSPDIIQAQLSPRLAAIINMAFIHTPIPSLNLNDGTSIPMV